MDVLVLDSLPTMTTLALFTGATLALFVMPGPATTYLVTRAVRQGRRAGLASALAVASGDIVHVVAAAAGITAVLMASATAFAAVKWAGAAYLIWIGVRTWREADPPSSTSDQATSIRAVQSVGAVFQEGFLVEVLNPKTALFFLAFVPQFIDPARGAVALQFLALGLVFIALSVAFCAALVVVAASARGMFRGARRPGRPARLVTGGVYVALGVAAAVAEAPR